MVARGSLLPLERCAAGPGCAAAGLLLDPACSHAVELVPLAAPRLQQLLQGHAGRLVLGAQLAALAAVAAAVAAARRAEAVSEGKGEGKGGAPPVRGRKAATKPAATAQGEGGERVAARARGAWLRTPFLPAEALVVLQAAAAHAGLQGAAALAATAAVAAALTWLGGVARAAAEAVAEAEARAPPAAVALAATWGAVRRGANLAGLCPAARRPDCGWGTPLALSLPGAGAASASPGPPLCGLDWLALAAASLLLLAGLATGLQAAALLLGGVELLLRPAWWALELPAGLRPGRRAPHSRAAAGARRWCLALLALSGVTAVSGSPSAVPGLWLLAAVLALARSAASRVALLAAPPPVPPEPAPRPAPPPALEGPDATASPPGALDVAQDVPQLWWRDEWWDTPWRQEDNADAPAVAWRARGGAPMSLAEAKAARARALRAHAAYRARLWWRRAQLAWVLFYAAYAMCAALALAAVARRVAARRVQWGELLSALAGLAAEAAQLAAGPHAGSAVQAAASWLASLPMAAPRAAAAALRVLPSGGAQLGYWAAALHAAVLLSGKGRAGPSGVLTRAAVHTAMAVLALGVWLGAWGAGHVAVLLVAPLHAWAAASGS